MNKKVVIGLAFAILFAIVGIIWASLSVSTKNREIDLRTGITGQQKKCVTHHANMWTILKEKAGVTDQYREAFEKIFPELIAGRYDKGDGSLMKWITESNPEFKIDLYTDLMASIKIERTAFINEQDKLIDMQREHTALLHKIPSKWFLGDDIKEIEIKTVASTRSNEAFEKGVEDDIDLFDKKDKK